MVVNPPVRTVYVQQPTTVYAVAPQAPAVVAAAPVPVEAPAPSTTTVLRNGFYQQGHDWAKDLRDDVVIRDQFVDYLKNNVINASSEDSAKFRRGFISAYGVNGDTAFDKALKKAQGN